MSKRSREDGVDVPTAMFMLGAQQSSSGLDLEESEAVRYTCAAVRLFLREHDAGEGSVHVTTRCACEVLQRRSCARGGCVLRHLSEAPLLLTHQAPPRHPPHSLQPPRVALRRPLARLRRALPQRDPACRVPGRGDLPRALRLCAADQQR